MQRRLLSEPSATNEANSRSQAWKRWIGCIPSDGRAGRRWNNRRLAHHWDAQFGPSPPRAQVSFHRDGTDGIVVMDVIQTRPSRRSDQLKLTIEAVRPKDQTRIDALAASELNDMELWISAQPSSGVSVMDSSVL